MFPPVIRMGAPPNKDQSFVVLIERRGWQIGRWHTAYSDIFIANDRSVPSEHRSFHRSTIRCWMPGDGS